MSIWTNQPFLRITIAFVLGIVVARCSFDLPIETEVFLISGLFILVLVGKAIFKYSTNIIWGNLLLIVVFFAGLLRYQLIDESNNSNQNLEAWTQSLATCGIISSFPEKKAEYVVHQVQLNAGILDSSFITTPTKLLLYAKRDSLEKYKFQYGDKIRITGNPFIIESAKNPFEFDFGKYMSDQGIFLQQFISSNQIQLISRSHGNGLMSAVYRVRAHFEEIIKKQVKEENEQAIVLALLLGIKSQLDADTKTAYAAAGAMHVLAVSGLHVSIIYFILVWAFKGIPSGDLKRFLVPTLSIVLLWLYALLTGFSPSILRAVSMFSIIIFAQILNKKSQIFNSLAFAAFVLLLTNPFHLFNVGFQLSFLAVAGIVYIYPRIHSIWNINNRIGDYFWKLTCVSIAAQIATFPLSLYYFNQFPTYFLLANIIVIPAALVIMILSISTLIVSPITNWMGWVLEKAVYCMSWCVRQIEQLDGSVIYWLYITGFETGIIYITIAVLLGFLSFKKTSFAYYLVFCLGIFSASRVSNFIAQSKSKELVFYSTGRNRMIDHVESFSVELMTLDTISNFEKQRRHMSPYRLHHFLSEPCLPTVASSNLGSFGVMRVFNGKKLLFLVEPFDQQEIQFKMKTDVVIVSNQSIESLSRLDEIIDFDEIILDTTNSHAYAKRLTSEAENSGYKLSDLRHQAYLIDLSGNEKFLNLLF